MQSGFYHEFRIYSRGQKRHDNPHSLTAPRVIIRKSSGRVSSTECTAPPRSAATAFTFPLSPRISSYLSLFPPLFTLGLFIIFIMEELQPATSCVFCLGRRMQDINGCRYKKMYSRNFIHSSSTVTASLHTSQPHIKNALVYDCNTPDLCTHWSTRSPPERCLAKGLLCKPIVSWSVMIFPARMRTWTASQSVRQVSLGLTADIRPWVANSIDSRCSRCRLFAYV